jgi:hypothetical protein
MNRLLRTLTIFLFLLPAVSFAQNGKLSGIITDRETKKPVPFAGVRVFSGGQLRGGAVAN